MSELFDLKLETDLSGFDSLVSDGGDLYHDTPGQASTAGQMAFLIDDTNALYGRKNFSSPDEYFGVRFYLDPQSVTPGGNLYVCRVALGESPWSIVQVYFRDNSGYELRLSVVEDGGGATTSDWHSLLSGENIIELLITRPTSDVASDGTVEIWINDSLEQTMSAKDFYDNFALINHLRVGPYQSIPGGASGTFSVDEIAARDDNVHIGPAEQPPEQQPQTLKRLVYFNYVALVNLAWGISDNVYTLSETTVQLCLSMLSTFPTWKDKWAGYDGYDWQTDVLEELVNQAKAELIPD